MQFPERQKTLHYLTPLRSPPKDRPYAVFDIESKHDDTQKKGFTRPFMVGFYDGERFSEFRNSPEANKLPWYMRAVAPGGCIDKFMWTLIGDPNRESRAPFAGHDIYAHNMGSFDGLFIPAWLERNSQRVSYRLMPVQSRIQAIEIWRHNPGRFRQTITDQLRADKLDRRRYGVVRILDSFRIMPGSLQKIALAFGLEGKLADMDLDLPEDDPIWSKYNEQDDVQLFQVLAKFKDMIMNKLGGEVGITAPSTAIKLLRRQYLDPDSLIHRNVHFEDCDPDMPTPQGEPCQGCAHAFFREAYFGGRTEIYTRKGTGWYYDVNSSYPFSMTKPMPVGEMTELGENVDFTEYTRFDKYVGFIRCTVEIPESAYLPCLPVQLDGKLKFPAGRFSGTWDWVELRCLGRIGGKILHVEKSVWIRAERFLTQFVNDLYAMRKKDSPQYKGPALSEVAKLILNSTFGKFGMDQDRLEMTILKAGEDEPWDLRYPGESDEHRQKRKKAVLTGDHRFRISVPLPGEPEEHFEDRKKAERRGVTVSPWRLPDMAVPSGIYEHDSLVRVRDIRIDAAYIIPQIAAHITALSRVILWTYNMIVVENGGRIFYSDTDSLIADYDKFPDSKDLGGLKREYPEPVTIEAVAPKMYRLTKKTPFEGIHIKLDGKEEKECLVSCPGCQKPLKGSEKEELLNGRVVGKHVLDEHGYRQCLKNCPGCSYEKIMMKGFPRDIRTSETLDKIKAKQTIAYSQHEKLGALAKKGFRTTPFMQRIVKAMRSTYDKRIMDPDTGETKPICITDPGRLSEAFRALPPQYNAPSWLDKLLENNKAIN